MAAASKYVNNLNVATYFLHSSGELLPLPSPPLHTIKICCFALCTQSFYANHVTVCLVSHLKSLFRWSRFNNAVRIPQFFFVKDVE